MAKIIGIENLSEQFKIDDPIMQKFVQKQNETITGLLIQIKKYEEEISHLKDLLASTTELIGDSKTQIIIATPEEVLCDAQIKYLTGKSETRELTLEETKKLDLLIKNKRLIKEDSAILNGKPDKIERKNNMSNSQLLKIASSKDKNDVS